MYHSSLFPKKANSSVGNLIKIEVTKDIRNLVRNSSLSSAKTRLKLEASGVVPPLVAMLVPPEAAARKASLLALLYLVVRHIGFAEWEKIERKIAPRLFRKQPGRPKTKRILGSGEVPPPVGMKGCQKDFTQRVLVVRAQCKKM